MSTHFSRWLEVGAPGLIMESTTGLLSCSLSSFTMLLSWPVVVYTAMRRNMWENDNWDRGFDEKMTLFSRRGFTAEDRDTLTIRCSVQFFVMDSMLALIGGLFFFPVLCAQRGECNIYYLPSEDKLTITNGYSDATFETTVESSPGYRNFCFANRPSRCWWPYYHGVKNSAFLVNSYLQC